MRILFVGDIVGEIGRKTLSYYFAKIRSKYRPHIVIVNGENAASGRGITEKIYKEFISSGVNAVTMGNHVWDNSDIFSFIDDAKYLVRPANLGEDLPGQGVAFVKYNQFELAVVNLQGRTFMSLSNDPFYKIDQMLLEIKARTQFIFLDFHAEATSEKQAMGWHLDGLVSAVVGTHTHVQTSDNRILPNKTAYISDVGMTGAYDGVLGMDKKAVLQRAKTQIPQRFEVVKTGRTLLSAVLIELDQKTGLAKSIERILINDDNELN